MSLKTVLAKLQGKKPHKGYVAICDLCDTRHESPTDSINDAVLGIKHSKSCPYAISLGIKMHPIVYKSVVYA